MPLLSALRNYVIKSKLDLRDFKLGNYGEPFRCWARLVLPLCSTRCTFLCEKDDLSAANDFIYVFYAFLSAIFYVKVESFKCISLFIINGMRHYLIYFIIFTTSHEYK